MNRRSGIIENPDSLPFFSRRAISLRLSRSLRSRLESSQENVSGTVEITLRPLGYTLVGVDSPFDLMKTDFGEYGEVNKAWSADDVKGFTKILGNQMKIFHNVQKRNGK